MTGVLVRLESAPRPEAYGPHPFAERTEIWFYDLPAKGQQFDFVCDSSTPCSTSKVTMLKLEGSAVTPTVHFRTLNSTYRLERIRHDRIR